MTLTRCIRRRTGVGAHNTSAEGDRPVPRRATLPNASNSATATWGFRKSWRVDRHDSETAPRHPAPNSGRG
jgi:hypothetical protein